jgi:hypothetical protein
LRYEYICFSSLDPKNHLKTNRGGILKTFMEPRNRFQGIDSASLCPGGPEPIFCRCLRRPEIDYEELIRKFQHRAGIFEQSVGTRKQAGVGLLYRPARARICKPFKEPGIDSSLAGWFDNPTCCTGSPGYIGWNRFLGSLNVYKYVSGYIG